MTLYAKRNLLEDLGVANVEQQQTKMICAACGEVVYDGPLREGRGKMHSHREQYHPELAKAAAIQATARRKVASGMTIRDLMSESRYVREYAAARRNARRALAEAE